jgi:hypothetical protein
MIPLTAATWDQASTNLMVASEFVFSKALTVRAGNSISPLDTDENIGSVKP